MNSYTDRTYNKPSSDGKQENKSAANKQSGKGSTFQLKDNRPETIAQRKLQKMADSSPQTEHTAQLQAKRSDPLINNQQTIQKKDNKTGLPDNLKSGVENLSGYSMDDVKVHRNSDKPAQLNAHAYAQGTDIHLAPGQEKHLPHEAWHVVQQKQGRVKPTKQLKDKVNINDDEGLEKEADVMGVKASQLIVQKKKIPLSKNVVTSNTAQLNNNGALKDTGDFSDLATDLKGLGPTASTSGFVLTEDLDELDDNDLLSDDTLNVNDYERVIEHENAAVREEHASIISENELKEINEPAKSSKGRKVGSVTGEEIKAHKGERVKINLGGKESLSEWASFSKSNFKKFTEKAKEFNAISDVTKKQELLKTLKPLARICLNDYESDVGKQLAKGKPDDNLMEKYTTLNGFLRQTTTNYPRVIKDLRKTQDTLAEFRSNPGKNVAVFHSAAKLYQQSMKRIEKYYTDYPPSINLMYVDEDRDIQKELGLIKAVDGISLQEPFDTKLGIEVKSGSARYDLLTSSLQFKGKLNLNFSNLKAYSGEVNVVFNSDLSIGNVTIDGAACKGKYLGFDFDFEKMSYDHGKNLFTIGKGTSKIELFENYSVNLSVENAKIENGNIDIEKLKGQVNGTFDTGFGLQIKDPFIAYKKGHVLLVKGGFGIDSTVGSTKAKGDLSVMMDTTDERNVQNVQIEGDIESEIAGLNVRLNKLNYTHNSQTLKAEQATANLDVLGHKIGMNIEEPTIRKGVLDFKSITGELPELDFDFIKLRKTRLSYSKRKKKIRANTTYNISNASSLGLSDLTSKGNVQITWSKTEGVAFEMNDGDIAFKIFNQAAHATKIEIDSKKRLLKAGEFKLDLDFGDQFKRSFNGKGVEFNQNGFDFSELSMAAGSEEINLQVLKLKPSKYSILKVGSGGYALKADGSVELTLPEILGVNGKGNLSGDISYNFKNKESDYHLKDGGAEVEVPNPLYKLGSLLGSDGGASTDFELGGAIPVFPGVAATFGVFLRFAASFGENIIATVKYDPKKDAILFHIGTSISAKVDAGAFIGVKGGYDVLISLEVRLEAGGEIKVTGNFGYGTVFPMNEQPKALAKLDKSKEGITYDMEGAVKLKAALALIASALYFFRKDFRIELGDGYELGSFTLDKEKGFQLNPTEKELASEEDLKKEADPEYKDEVAKMNIEDLLNKDYTYRFTKDEKSTTKKAFEAEEENRKKAFNTIEGHRDMFYSVPIEDMKRFNHFINNRFNWDGIMKNFMDTQELPAEKLVENTKENESNGNSRYKFYVLETLGSLGNDINIAQAFVDHYAELLKKIEDKKSLYTSHDMFHTYLTHLNSKHKLIKEFEEFKRKYLHSQRKTDKGIQLESTETGKGLFDLFESNYQTLANDYKNLSDKFLTEFYVISEISEQEKTLITELRTDFENKKGQTT